MTERVWLALGSNLGASKTILIQAWHELGRHDAIELICLSRPYESDPVGMDSDNLFVNAVGILETDLAPRPLLTRLQEVERGFGRDKKTGVNGYQDRLLDLDILYFGERVQDDRILVLPHPHIAARLFVLAPLAEIDAMHSDPVHGRSAGEMHLDLLQQIAAGQIASQQIHRDRWE